MQSQFELQPKITAEFINKWLTLSPQEQQEGFCKKIIDYASKERYPRISRYVSAIVGHNTDRQIPHEHLKNLRDPQSHKHLLRIAIDNDNDDLVNILLANGDDPTCRIRVLGATTTLLHYAVGQGKFAIAHQLANVAPDVNFRNDAGMAPLDSLMFRLHTHPEERDSVYAHDLALKLIKNGAVIEDLRMFFGEENHEENAEGRSFLQNLMGRAANPRNVQNPAAAQIAGREDNEMRRS